MFGPRTRSLILRTRLTPDEVRQRLKRAIGAPRGWNPFEPKGELYLGSLRPNGFKVQRQGPAKNPYRAVVTGELSSDRFGSRITLYMEPPFLWIGTFVIATLAVGLALLNLLTIILKAISGELPPMGTVAEAVFISAGFVALGYALTSGTLKHEYDKVARYFAGLLDAEEIQEQSSRSPSTAA